MKEIEWAKHLFSSLVESGHLKKNLLKNTETEEVTSLTVRTPATSANLGSGFDCIGVCLDCWNELQVSRALSFSIKVFGAGEGTVPEDASNLVVVGLELAFSCVGVAVPDLEYICNNNIPCAKGLGSSSAGITAGLLAGFALNGYDMMMSEASRSLVLNISCDVEGHPDNVAPALLGGIQIGIIQGTVFNVLSEEGKIVRELPYKDSLCVSVAIDRVVMELVFLVFVPDYVIKTSEARTVIPQTVDLSDAVFNASRTAMMTSALISGKWDMLKVAMDDKLHQPHRGKSLVPHLYPVMDTALHNGAYGASLSGSGSSVIVIADSKDIASYSDIENPLHKAIVDAAYSKGVQGKLHSFLISPKGAYLFSVVVK